MADAYKTIEAESYAEFKDRGSKFLAYLFPVTTEAELTERIKELQAEHFKAGHHCPAIRLRDGFSRSSDNGEPSGTAGKPILNQLLSAELVDVACVVVRYWGGTKLGVSGLINAYKSAAKLAVEASTIVTKYETETVYLDFDYAIMGNLLNGLKQLNIAIAEKQLTANPRLILEIKQSEVDATIISIKAKMLGRAVADITEDTEVVGLSFQVAS